MDFASIELQKAIVDIVLASIVASFPISELPECEQLLLGKLLGCACLPATVLAFTAMAAQRK